MSHRVVSNEDIERIPELEKKLEQMLKYATSAECRRKLLLEYFGEKVEVTNCGNCDNCLNTNKNEQTHIDMSKETELYLKAVQQTGEKYGLSMCLLVCLCLYSLELPAYVLRGSTTKRILTAEFNKLSVYGKGAYFSMDW